MTEWLQRLKETIGANKVLSSPVDLIAYSFDGTFEQHLPEAVVLPETNEEVSTVVRIASQFDVPIVPRGMSSGLAGGSIPVRGGIVMSLTRMNRILEIDEANMTATVQSGVVTADLQAEVEKRGLFYPPDPSSIKQSTIGGNVACNAGGPRCLKYGVTGDYVLGLTIVLADGCIVRTGGKVIKYVTGFNMNQVFVGSEGALGIITEVILRLIAKPPYARTALVHFPTLEDASRTVQAILTRGLVPATMELLDETAIACIEEAMHLGLPLDVEAILLIESDGADEGWVVREIDAIADICLETGASRVDVARNEEERADLWRARRSVSPSLARKAPNKLGEDITVPRSAIPEAVRRIKAISAAYGLPIVVFGHAGDGNLHPNILFDRRDPEQWQKVELIVSEIFRLALELGGTLSGEHGIGTFKLPYVCQALGPASINIQWRVKQALDPQNILNPGKVLPEPCDKRIGRSMLELKKGVDILSAVGGIGTLDEASALFKARCDQENLAKLGRIANEEALLKIANAISMTDPDVVFVNTGSEADIQRVREMSLAKGEEQPLAMKDHTIHFDLPQEQARIIDRTFYIVNEGEGISVLAKKILRDEAHNYVRTHMAGIARGKTLLVGFFSRGPIGAQAAIPALEITTSTYVMHSANILYRHAYGWFDKEVQRVGLFFTNVHSEGPNRPEDLPYARVFMDRSWLTTFSMFCTYAGNTLLLKKGNHRFAVDLATYYRRERELSEHMFITGLTGPDGRKTYFAGAAPSGCGKTATAMVGTDFIGDDLAQMWIAKDGTLRAINPECGIFGIVHDVNSEDDPHLMKCLREEGTEVIWSNVLIDEHGVPHWVGNGGKHPKRGVNFQGEWREGKTDENGKPIPLSHPNSRCTLRNSAIGNYNEAAAEDPAGVEIKVITYSGRDSDTMPPVWVAKNPDHGVVIGASILSAATATEVGAEGVRRQPWANEPFIPGPLADYMDAQFAFFNSDKLKNKPIMAGLNYFLTHKARGGQGSGLLGAKHDVKAWLGWLELRAHGDVDAIETPIGFIPKYEHLRDLFAAIGKEYPKALYDKQFAFYVDNILARIDLQEKAYRKEENIPRKLFEVYEEQRRGLETLRAKYGSIVSVEQLIEAAGKHAP